MAEPGAETPAAGDRDEFVRAAAQFLADVVDQQVELARLADQPRKNFTGHRFR